MRKKIITSIIMLLLLPAALFAHQWLIPYHGFSGIPIDSPIFQVLPTTGAVDWNRSSFSECKGQYVGSGMDERLYYDWNMIATGGVNNIKYDAQHQDLIMTLSVTSPSGLNFVSLSQPSIVRPYTIQLIMVVDYGGGGSHRFPVVSFDQNGKTETFRLSDMIAQYGTPGDLNMHFDLVISLPGDRSYVPKAETSMVKNEKLRLESGAEIPIIEAEDYVSVINIDMKWKFSENGEEFQDQISIPINGFYKKGVTDNTHDQTPFSVNIRTMPITANIDIDRMQGNLLHIADISFMHSEFESTSNPWRNFGMFFSSSPDPTQITGDGRFRLVHDEIRSNDTTLLNIRNNIGYTLKVIPGSYEFDGTMTVDLSQPLSAYEGRMIIPPKSERQGIDPNRKASMQEYAGQLFLQLEAKDVKMMKGRYESMIYVHIVSE